MPNPQQEAADRVAQMINDAEREMDYAMAQTSRLVTELPSLQTEAGLNAAWAQPVVVSLCSALGDMGTARGSIIGAHKSLSAIQRRLGLATMESPNNDKNVDVPVIPKTAHDDRRVVALRA
ncbi:MAG: hypothetical protein ACSLE1_13055 [Sphingobium sp.]